jgi:broad specificity phosphatase PhoE
MNVQKWPTNLVLVRHGQSERNVLREAAKQRGQLEFFHGGLRDLDAPLTSHGYLQSRLTGEFLAGRYRFDVAFSSPHLRSRQTLDEIAEAWPQPLPVLLDERVREIEFGSLDGLTWQGIKHRYPEEFARREREGKYWYRPPGGESAARACW